MNEVMKYEDAVKELEIIVRRMENEELDVDSLTSQLRRAQQLIRLCKERLMSTDEEIRKLLEGDGEK